MKFINIVINYITIFFFRFKSAGFLDEQSRNKAKELLRQNIRRCMEEKAAKARSTSRKRKAAETESSSKKYTLWDNLSDSESENEVEESTSQPFPFVQSVSESRVEEALSYYWESPRISQHDDPFIFWQKNSAEFPEVYSIALTTFSCPSGSVDSERLFSLAGDVINVKRTNLLPENAEDQIFLSKNLPFFEFDY